MIEKAVSIAMMLTFIMIGINAMLYMGSVNLYDQEGYPLNLYYGLDSGGYGSQMSDKAQSIEISTDPSFSSTAPSQQQGFTPITSSDNPVGMDWGAEFLKLGFGVQLVLLKFSELFPILAPITGGLGILAFAIQGFAMAYVGGSIGRAIVGRVV